MSTRTIETFAGLRCHLIVPAGPVRAAVVLLHGFGAPGDDLVALADYLDLPAGTAVACPEAPLALSGLYGDARAWWMIDLEALQRDQMRGVVRDRSAEVPDGLEPARAAVDGLIDQLEIRLGLAPGRVVLGGFSQGAMLSLDVALHRTTAAGGDGTGLAGLVLMSGTLLARDRWTPRLPRLAGVPVFQSHGRSDQLLPFAVAEHLADLLRTAGAGVEWQAFAGGHEIPPPVLAGASRLLTRALAG